MLTHHSTGATGYIGGDVLSQLVLKYPQFVYRVLVRGPEKGSTIKSQYPSVQIVYGDLSSTEVLETESADANIIIREILHLQCFRESPL